MQGQLNGNMDSSELLQMKAAVIDQMASPVVMFGADDVVKTFNQAAKDNLIVGEGMTLQEFAGSSNLRYILTPERRKMGQTREFHLAVHMQGKTYLIHGKEQWDPDGRYLGVFMVYDDITDQENMKDEATYYATHDKLTGLWNRDYFFEMVEKVLGDNPDTTFLMVASDITQFKLFKEILGIRTGNELLLSISEAYRRVRKANWVFSRFEEDRFALLLPKADYNEKRFLDFCHKVFEQSHFSLEVHNILGVYEIVNPRLKPEFMYSRAYLALESIRGNVQKEVAYYDEKIRARRLAERLTVDELEHALKDEEFVIYIQPQINSKNNQVVGGETLVRWISPKRGMVPPSEFVPMFEKNGMITKMDYHVWELACRQLAKWKAEGKEERSLSINISAKNFYLSDLYERITGLVERYGVDPQRLKLEITETAFVLDVKKQMALVKRLQQYGFLVEMDDFGSGYSSLNSLKDISVDILKLDMKFFEASEDPRRSEKIIASMVGLANSLAIPVIAEGVEKKEQIDYLDQVGCHMVQGYYYSRPMPVEDYEIFMQTHENGDIRELIRELKEKEPDI
jgi:diguanylate cyclase (GGDEF)-like protein